MEFFKQNIESSNEEVVLPILKEKGIKLFVKREDKIHPFVSGNKFRKLKYNIEESNRLGKDTILTFGGAYSNHIVATAIAGKLANMKTIGVIRGDELANCFDEVLRHNDTLKKAHESGMKFDFVSRKVYRNKKDFNYLKELSEKYNKPYIIPEGGTNSFAIKGCEEILSLSDFEFDCVCCSVGTGGTISGLINASDSNQNILGFPALKGSFLEKDIGDLVDGKSNWRLIPSYNFGGYAKYNSQLIRFINEFYQDTKILLDPIYTGKMMFGVLDLIKKDFFQKGTQILVVHTGGLQGISGVNNKLKKNNLKQIVK